MSGAIAPPEAAPKAGAGDTPPPPSVPVEVREVGGRAGPEPTRYGDWEKNGRCIDF